jgi:protein-arginine deiminase
VSAERRTEVSTNTDDFYAVAFQYFTRHPPSVSLCTSKIAIAAPKGPRDDEQPGAPDAFKAYLENNLPGGLTPGFIDNWNWYHSMDGEIHCETNARRAMPATNWWD